MRRAYYSDRMIEVRIAYKTLVGKT
jgi:hypothetical protein